MARLKDLFTRKLEICLIGLENSGKTTLLNQMSFGEALKTAPTIGLNVRNVKKGNIKMKVWDIGGQAQYRSQWPKYTKGCDVIIFMVDASDADYVSQARKELHILLEDPELTGIPLLILSNKIDVDPHLSEVEIINGKTKFRVKKHFVFMTALSYKFSRHES